MIYFALPETDWARRILFRVEVGSTAHGTGKPGHEDHDEIAVQWEPTDSIVGLTPTTETIVHRPGRGPADRSGPGDWDLTVYTARKFAGLAAKGNPSILVALFGPTIDTSELHRELDPTWFWSEQARARFLGYAESQRQRMTGERGKAGRLRRSPEGGGDIDWKYAMHMVRLGIQGLEFMTTGRITLPVPEPHRSLLLDIRHGRLTLPEVVDIANDNEAQLLGLEPARPKPDIQAINAWLFDVFEHALSRTSPGPRTITPRKRRYLT